MQKKRNCIILKYNFINQLLYIYIIKYSYFNFFVSPFLRNIFIKIVIPDFKIDGYS